MSEFLSDTARAACRKLLRPVVRMLLRLGISWNEFSEIAKLVFVEVARQDYGLHGRPTNASRVALMTGLSRREVGDIRRKLEDEQPLAIEPKSRISRLLTGWHADPDFTFEGRPLALNGEAFLRLARRYAGDIPERAITKEMLDLGLMERLEDGRYRVTRRDYLRDAADPDIVRHMGQALHDHGVSLAHNLDPERTDGWFEGLASNAHMPRGTAERLNTLLQQEGQAFLEKMDAWLTEHALPAEGERSSTGKSRVGVGVYLFEYPEDDS